jgi:uncharacterized protein involved in exopolysaccharide biosynthesis
MPETVQLLRPDRAPVFPTRRDIAAIFFRNKKLLVTSFVGVFAAGCLYTALFPSYKAEMKIVVRRARMDPAVAPVATVPPVVDREEVTDEEMNSEADLLQDQELLRKVVADSGLAGRASWFSRWRNEPEEVRIEHATRRLAGALVIQPVRKSRLIAISYESSDPQRSAAVLRSLAETFIAKQVEIHRPTGQQAFFEAQMKEARLQLDEAQQKLLDFTRENGVSAAGLQRDLAVQKLSEAEASDMALQASVLAGIERAKSLETSLRNMPKRRVMQIRNADNPQLQEKLKSKLLELELRRTELLTRYQPGYRLVQQVEQEIAQTRAAIEVEDARPLRDEITEQDPDYQWAHSEQLKNQVELKTLEKRLALAHTQIVQYQATAQKLNETAVTEDLLEQKLRAARDRYLMYASKREEARIGDALDQGKILNVAVAEQPHAPALPVWPLWSAACLSFLGASAFSTGLVFAADYLNSSFRNPDDVTQYLGLPVLGYLPAIEADSTSPKEVA